MRIVALITMSLLLAGCAALEQPPVNQDDANALYLQNRCLGGVGDGFRGPYSCFEADNRGWSAGGGPGFVSATGGGAF
jgi:hypothetical protein